MISDGDVASNVKNIYAVDTYSLVPKRVFISIKVTLRYVLKLPTNQDSLPLN